MATTYSTTVIDQNTRQVDGTPIVLRDCGHKHRTLTGAERCHHKLTKRNRDGSWSAMWHNALVMRSDGSYLTIEEADTVYDLRARR